MGFISSGSQFTVSNISYDPQGNIETLIRNAPTSANPDGAPVDNLTYTYTPRTNRLASVADAVTTDFDWDARPTSFVYNRVGSVTWTTEELTPTTYRETEIQVYDERQLPEELRIRLIATPGGAYDSTLVSYRYDVNGQRIRKQIRETAQGPDVVYERYVRDGMRLIGVFDESNNLQNWNIGGAAGLVGRAEPATLGFTRHYYISDHLGSIRAVINQSGTVIEGRDYYPYGLTMPGRFYVLADTTREGFTGYELDKETGLYYAGARSYNPALARWAAVDAFREYYSALSPYSYAGNNPISIIDVNGDTLFAIGPKARLTIDETRSTPTGEALYQHLQSHTQHIYVLDRSIVDPESKATMGAVALDGGNINPDGLTATYDKAFIIVDYNKIELYNSIDKWEPVHHVEIMAHEFQHMKDFLDDINNYNIHEQERIDNVPYNERTMERRAFDIGKQVLDEYIQTNSE